MQRTFWEQLDAANDEADVRRRITEGLYFGPHLGIAKEWIRKRDAARSEAAEERKEKREKESLSISRKALRFSILATTIATVALIVTVCS